MKIVLPEIEKDLKVYIAGIGYETNHEEIFRACYGWVDHYKCQIDGMIWGDGKFPEYPAENDFSENGWLDAVEKRYKDKCDVITYEFAGDQVEKRQRYLDIAGKHKVDVLIAVDTEEFIRPDYNDFDKFYKNLLMHLEYTPDRMFYQWVWIPNQKLWPHQGNEFESNTWLPSAKIHKDPGTMRFCCDRHYIWCDKKTTDTKLYKWQLKHPNKENPYEFKPHYTIDGVRIGMDRTLRTKEQIRKGKEWALINSHIENSRQFYKIADIEGKFPPPEGFKSWAEWEAKPHTFTTAGKRIEL